MNLKEYKELYDSMVLNEEADQRVLDGIKMRGGNIMNKKHYRLAWKAGRIAAVVMAVIITGVAVYAAAEMWNSNVAKQAGVYDKPDLRNKMSEEGFSQYTGDDKVNFSVKDEGITVSVIQTLADRYCAVVFFEADFSSKYQTEEEELDFNGIKTEAVNVLPHVVFKCNGKVLDQAELINGVSKVINGHKVSYRYNIGSYDREEFPDNAGISMEIDSFTAYTDKSGERPGIPVEKNVPVEPDILVTGEWTVKWNLSVGTERRIYTLNYPLESMDMKFKLKEFDISPLSYSILLEEDGWTVEERKKFEKERNTNNIRSVLNGITMGHKNFMAGGISHRIMGRNEEGKLYIRQGWQLGNVLDIEKVTGISVVNKVIDYISFEDCSYTVVK